MTNTICDVISFADLVGGTYGGNPVACAAALATLDVFSQEDVLLNVIARGKQLTEGLQVLQKQYQALIKDVRGPGLMIGIELENSDPTLARDISQACLHRNMLLMSTGVRQTLRLMPPLVVTEEECDEALHIMEQAVRQVALSRSTCG